MAPIKVDRSVSADSLTQEWLEGELTYLPVIRISCVHTVTGELLEYKGA